MKSVDAIQALAALAQDSRLAVYRLLVKRGPEGFTPSELGTRLQIAAPTLSFHLKELQRAGLVSTRREGRYLHYSANFARMQKLIGFLTENCCSLSDTACDPNCSSASTPVQKKRVGT